MHMCVCVTVSSNAQCSVRSVTGVIQRSMSQALPFDIIALIIDIAGENKGGTNLFGLQGTCSGDWSHSFLQICFKQADPINHLASSKKGLVKCSNRSISLTGHRATSRILGFGISTNMEGRLTIIDRVTRLKPTHRWQAKKKKNPVRILWKFLLEPERGHDALRSSTCI